jgi:hypothetical protein
MAATYGAILVLTAGWTTLRMSMQLALMKSARRLWRLPSPCLLAAHVKSPLP